MGNDNVLTPEPGSRRVLFVFVSVAEGTAPALTYHILYVSMKKDRKNWATLALRRED